MSALCTLGGIASGPPPGLIQELGILSLLGILRMQLEDHVGRHVALCTFEGRYQPRSRFNKLDGGEPPAGTFRNSQLILQGIVSSWTGGTPYTTTMGRL